MNVFIRAILRIFSFGEQLIVETIDENILTIALINIHYLYIIQLKFSCFPMLLLALKAIAQ